MASLLKMKYAPALPSRTLTWRPGIFYALFTQTVRFIQFRRSISGYFMR